MSFTECSRPRRVWALLLVLLTLATFTASCSDPEKEKAEHVRRGEAFLKEQKYQEASIEFRNAMQIDDKLAAAHWGLAQAYEGLQRPYESLEELQRTIQLDPENSLARLKLGNAYIEAYNRYKKEEYLKQAEQFASEIVAKDPKNVDGQILTANVLHLRGRNDEALAKLKYAIELDPQRIESYIGLARFYLQTNRPGEAEATFQRALSVNDQSALAHIEYGRYFVQTGRADRAEAEFRRAVEVEPQNRDVRWVLASFYLVNNRLDRAEQAYRDYAQLDWDKPDGRARLADYFATVGRYDEAVNSYQDIVKTFPDFARARHRLGEIMLQRGDVQGARAQVDELLKRNERDLDALLLRARMSIMGNKVKDAINDLKVVLEQEPRSQLGLYYMTDALYRDGQLEQARVRAGELERYHPTFLPAKLLQLQINFDSGDYAMTERLADDLLERLSKTAPSGQQSPQLLADLKTNTLLLRGRAHLNLRRAKKNPAEANAELAAARADLEAARNVSPNSPTPYVGMADVAMAEGKRDEAAQHIERALSIDRTNFQALTAFVTLQNIERRLDAARARIEQLISEQPNNASLHFLRGNAYILANEAQPMDAQKAEESWRRALEIDPDYLLAYFSLADYYYRGLNDPERAIAEYRKAAERRPEAVLAYTGIGVIEGNRQNFDAAEQSYRRALSIKPDETFAANNLAMLYADYGRGNGDEAMRLAQEVVSRYPDSPSYADTLGWVYYRKGLHAAAVEQLQKAVKGAVAVGGDNSLYRYHLGMALAAKGDKASARRELQASLRMVEQEQARPVKPPTPTPVDEARRMLASL